MYSTKRVIIIMLIFVLGLTGYVKNIIKLSECDFAPPYKAEVIHTIGLIPLMGAFTGWLDVGR
jgi:hypothetical protein